MIVEETARQHHISFITMAQAHGFCAEIAARNSEVEVILPNKPTAQAAADDSRVATKETGGGDALVATGDSLTATQLLVDCYSIASQISLKDDLIFIHKWLGDYIREEQLASGTAMTLHPHPWSNLVGLSATPSTSSPKQQLLTLHDLYCSEGYVCMGLGNDEGWGAWKYVWMKIMDEVEGTLALFENGPQNPSTAVFACVHSTSQPAVKATLEFSDIHYPKSEIGFVLNNCRAVDEVSGSAEQSVSMRFKFKTDSEYMGWATSLFRFCGVDFLSGEIFAHVGGPYGAEEGGDGDSDASSELDDPFKWGFSARRNTDQLSAASTTSQPLRRRSSTNNGSSSGIASYTMEFIEQLLIHVSERELAKTGSRSKSVSGAKLRSAVFQASHHRIVAIGSNRRGGDALLGGSVLLSVNGLSAVTMPSATVLQFLRELPDTITSEVLYWRVPIGDFSVQLLKCDAMQTRASNLLKSIATGFVSPNQTDTDTTAAAVVVSKKNMLVEMQRKATMASLAVSGGTAGVSTETPGKSTTSASAESAVDSQAGAIRSSLASLHIANGHIVLQYQSGTDENPMKEEVRISLGSCTLKLVNHTPSPPKKKATGDDMVSAKTTAEVVAAIAPAGVTPTLALEITDESHRVVLSAFSIAALLTLAQKISQGMMLMGSMNSDLQALYDISNMWKAAVETAATSVSASATAVVPKKKSLLFEEVQTGGGAGDDDDDDDDVLVSSDVDDLFGGLAVSTLPASVTSTSDAAGDAVTDNSAASNRAQIAEFIDKIRVILNSFDALSTFKPPVDFGSILDKLAGKAPHSAHLVEEEGSVHKNVGFDDMESVLGLGHGDHEFSGEGCASSLPTIATIRLLLQCIQTSNEINHHLLMDLIGLRRHLVREWCIAKPVKGENENESTSSTVASPQPTEKLVTDSDSTASAGSKQEQDPLGVSCCVVMICRYVCIFGVLLIK